MQSSYPYGLGYWVWDVTVSNVNYSFVRKDPEKDTACGTNSPVSISAQEVLNAARTDDFSIQLYNDLFAYAPSVPTLAPLSDEIDFWGDYVQDPTVDPNSVSSNECFTAKVRAAQPLMKFTLNGRVFTADGPWDFSKPDSENPTITTITPLLNQQYSIYGGNFSVEYGTECCAQ